MFDPDIFLTVEWFFFISKKDVYSKNCFMQKNRKHIRDYKEEKKKNRKENWLQSKKELRNKGRESLDVSPQALAQS